MAYYNYWDDITKIKSHYLNLPLDQKRKEYRCREDFTTLDTIETWSKYAESLQKMKPSAASSGSNSKFGNASSRSFTYDPSINDRVSLWLGDITHLEIDAIVNAANQSLLGGCGVDGAIHFAAGSCLERECSTLDGCETGEAKITGGYQLPAKYVIHTVGPMYGYENKKLESCYRKSLQLLEANNCLSIAFPSISTGLYGFPAADAAHIALRTVREFFDENAYAKRVKRVIFCIYIEDEHNLNLYEKLMPIYFPTYAPPDGPAPTDSKREGSEPTGTKREGPEPTGTKRETPPPTDAKREGPAPTDTKREGPEPTDTKRDGPASAQTVHTPEAAAAGAEAHSSTAEVSTKL